MSTADGPAYPIESVDRALSLILAFEKADNITVTEAGKFLGVSRSTAYRLLSVLQPRAFAIQHPRTKAFRAGPALLRAGLAAVQRSDIRATLHPLLEAVVAEVQETAHLVVLQREEAFYLDCVESARVVRATARVGTSLPAHVSAGGKVLLANLGPLRAGARPWRSAHGLTSGRAMWLACCEQQDGVLLKDHLSNRWRSQCQPLP